MRLVIAEDQVLLRDGIRRLVEAAGHTVIAEVGDARSLIIAVNDQHPDLVIADIRMPPGFTDDGARAVHFLRARMPTLPVVVLSQHIEPSVLHGSLGIDATAFGYLLKDRVLDTDTFLTHLDHVARGGTVIDPEIIARTFTAEHARLSTLSVREQEILRHVATGRSNSGIASELYISRRTVEAHLRSIFGKLHLSSEPDSNQRVLAVLQWLNPLANQLPDQGDQVARGRG